MGGRTAAGEFHRFVVACEKTMCCPHGRRNLNGHDWTERFPSVSGWSSFANKGLLVTYGTNVRALYRSLAGYVDRILRGTAPADLPFQAPTTLYLAINQKTAKALGVDVPPILLARADEVIE